LKSFASRFNVLLAEVTIGIEFQARMWTSLITHHGYLNRKIDSTRERENLTMVKSDFHESIDNEINSPRPTVNPTAL